MKRHSNNQKITKPFMYCSKFLMSKKTVSTGLKTEVVLILLDTSDRQNSNPNVNGIFCPIFMQQKPICLMLKTGWFKTNENSNDDKLEDLFMLQEDKNTHFIESTPAYKSLGIHIVLPTETRFCNLFLCLFVVIQILQDDSYRSVIECVHHKNFALNSLTIGALYYQNDQFIHKLQNCIIFALRAQP